MNKRQDILSETMIYFFLIPSHSPWTDSTESQHHVLPFSGTQSELGSFTPNPENREDFLLFETGSNESGNWGPFNGIIKCHLHPFIVQINPNPSQTTIQGQGVFREATSMVLSPVLFHSPNPMLRVKSDTSFPWNRLSDHPYYPPGCPIPQLHLPVMFP